MAATHNSYCHRGGGKPLLGATIPQHLATIVARFADNDAVVSIPQGRRLSYAQLAETVEPLARGFML